MDTPTSTPSQRGRYCDNCGRAVPYKRVIGDVRCPRCSQHLHTCGNCVYFDGIDCEIRRSEAHEVYRGLNCPQFQFRRTVPPRSGESP